MPVSRKLTRVICQEHLMRALQILLALSVCVLVGSFANVLRADEVDLRTRIANGILPTGWSKVSPGHITAPVLSDANFTGRFVRLRKGSCVSRTMRLFGRTRHHLVAVRGCRRPINGMTVNPGYFGLTYLDSSMNELTEFSKRFQLAGRGELELDQQELATTIPPNAAFVKVWCCNTGKISETLIESLRLDNYLTNRTVSYDAASPVGQRFTIASFDRDRTVPQANLLANGHFASRPFLGQIYSDVTFSGVQFWNVTKPETEPGFYFFNQGQCEFDRLLALESISGAVKLEQEFQRFQPGQRLQFEIDYLRYEGESSATGVMPAARAGIRFYDENDVVVREREYDLNDRSDNLDAPVKLRREIHAHYRAVRGEVWVEVDADIADSRTPLLLKRILLKQMVRPRPRGGNYDTRPPEFGLDSGPFEADFDPDDPDFSLVLIAMDNNQGPGTSNAGKISGFGGSYPYLLKDEDGRALPTIIRGGVSDQALYRIDDTGFYGFSVFLDYSIQLPGPAFPGQTERTLTLVTTDQVTDSAGNAVPSAMPVATIVVRYP